MHIQTDMVIGAGDHKNIEEFKERKEKYFGEKSMLRLVHQEEVQKLNEQR